MTKISNNELLKLMQDDNLRNRDRAFLHMYKEFFPAVLKMIIQNKGTEDVAKDVFQDGIIILYNQIQKGAFRGDSTLKTYLYSICRNLWLKKLTRNPGSLELKPEMITEVDDTNALQSMLGTERERCIEKLLDQIGEECNKILKYFYFDKLSMKKIKDTLGLASEQVAKNKKFKCIKRLRSLVQENAHYLSLLKT